MKKIKDIYKKYEDIILYIFFGGLTTVINILSYFITYNLLEIQNVPSTIIAWIISVIFAFIVNKKYVFKSLDWSKKIILSEGWKFTSCRIGSGILEIIIMYIFVDLLNFNGLLFKVLTNILVIILNYIASKLLIFKK